MRPHEAIPQRQGVSSGPSPTRADRVAVIERIRDARVRRDYCAFEACFIPDAVFWIIGQRDRLPFSGCQLGKLAMSRALRQMDGEIEYLDFTVGAPIIEGDQAVVRWASRVRHIGTSREAQTKGVAQMRFSGLLISEFTYFLDTQAVARLVSRE